MAEPTPRPYSRLAAANRYLNTETSGPARAYGFAFLAWLRNGAVGYAPTRGKLTAHRVEAIKLKLFELLGGDPFEAVRETI